MKGSIFSTKLYGHHQVSELNMSEHFLGSNKAFEILANLGLEPLTLDLDRQVVFFSSSQEAYVIYVGPHIKV
jgi:hypothetical protein